MNKVIIKVTRDEYEAVEEMLTSSERFTFGLNDLAIRININNEKYILLVIDDSKQV